jgi:hypothetical protein
MLGDKAQAARARGRDGDGPAQQQVARRLGVHGQQAHSGTASSSGRGRRGVTRAARCERARTPATGAAVSHALACACVQGAGHSSSRQHACAHLNNF